jgi:hypothetical protein
MNLPVRKNDACYTMLTEKLVSVIGFLSRIQVPPETPG